MNGAGAGGTRPDPAAGLRRSAASGRLAHAYLLVGPSGPAQELALGLAAAALCEGAVAGAVDCGCASCRAVRGGWHPDLRLVDLSGSVIRIAHMREVARAASLSPARGRRRVFVVQPADRLSGPAANALLKVLEEPPAPALFILVTEKRFSLPPTVLSRCQLVRVAEPGVAPDADWDEAARLALERAAAGDAGFLDAAVGVMTLVGEGDLVPFLDALERELHRRLRSESAAGAAHATARLGPAIDAVEDARGALAYHANARLTLEALLIVAARATARPSAVDSQPARVATQSAAARGE